MTPPGGDLSLEMERLRTENARLIALLEANSIDWHTPEPAPMRAASIEQESSSLTTEQKVALFRRLFRGRTDVYPIRWESQKTGKSGYAPACANEWLAGLCEKQRVNSGESGQVIHM